MALPVVFNYSEEKGLLLGVECDPIEEEGTHSNGPLAHVIHHLKT